MLPAAMPEVVKPAAVSAAPVPAMAPPVPTRVFPTVERDSSSFSYFLSFFLLSSFLFCLFSIKNNDNFYKFLLGL